MHAERLYLTKECFIMTDIAAHSIDFDGCLVHKRNSDPLMSGRPILNKIKHDANEAQQTVALVGSMRQDYDTEVINRAQYAIGFGCCYRDMEKVVDKLSSDMEVANLSLDRLLLADIYNTLEFGTAFKDAIALDTLGAELSQLETYLCCYEYLKVNDPNLDLMGAIKKQITSEDSYTQIKAWYEENTSELPEEDAVNALRKHLDDMRYAEHYSAQLAAQPSAVTDKMKVSLIYAQAHHLACQYPNQSITLNFYDDKWEILNVLKEHYETNPGCLPNSVTLVLHQYGKYSDTLTTQATIQGQGQINEAFGETLRSIVKEKHPDIDLANGNNYPKHDFTHDITEAKLCRDLNKVSLEDNNNVNDTANVRFFQPNNPTTIPSSQVLIDPTEQLKL